MKAEKITKPNAPEKPKKKTRHSIRQKSILVTPLKSHFAPHRILPIYLKKWFADNIEVLMYPPAPL
jgi:hypothetical protein